MTHLFVFLAGLLISAGSIAAAPTADEIIDSAAKQPTPESSAVKLKMVLISQRGSKTLEQERTVDMFALQSPEGNRSMLKFKAPKDVAGVSLLVRGNPDGSSDQWLYMPALKQDPKRIAGGQKNASFLGTDFTFADMAGRNNGQWTHKLLREESLNGQATWVIESLPQPGTDTQYQKTIQWIRQDIRIPIKVEFYTAKGLLKVLTVESLKQVDGYWISTRTRMHNIVKKHSTVLEILEQKNNLEFPSGFFTTRQMKNS